MAVRPRLFDMAWTRTLLDGAHLDAVVATSAEHVFLLSGHGTWLEGQMRSWMARPGGADSAAAGFALLARDGRVGLVVSPVTVAEGRLSDADVVRPYERTADGSGPARALLNLLAEMNLSAARVGIERSSLDAAVMPDQTLEWPDASVLLRLARMVKGPEAINRLRAAAAATESLLRTIADEWEQLPDPTAVQRRCRMLLAEQNMDLDHFVYGAPGGGIGVHTPRPTDPHGLLFVDAGARTGGFVSDTGVTFGPATPRESSERAVYAQCAGSIQAGAEMLGPGVPGSAVLAAMQAEVTAPALRPQAHGLGIGIREWPFFGAASDARLTEGDLTIAVDQPLQAGMVINLEVGGHHGPTSSVQIEQTYVITATGAELITAQRRDTPWATGSSTCSERSAGAPPMDHRSTALLS